MMPYLVGMLGLSTSELAIVVFILLLVILAGRLPRWGEALGSHLYKRGKPRDGDEDAGASHDGPAARTSDETGSPREVPPPH